MTLGRQTARHGPGEGEAAGAAEGTGRMVEGRMSSGPVDSGSGLKFAARADGGRRRRTGSTRSGLRRSSSSDASARTDRTSHRRLCPFETHREEDAGQRHEDGFGRE